MDLLLEFAFILSKYPIKSIDGTLPIGSKIRKLFDAVLGGQVKTDTEAAEYLYQTSASDKRYLMLKRNLTNKLFELLLHSDAEKEKKFSRSKRKDIFNQEETRLLAIQYLIVAEKLLSQNVYHNAEKIIERTREKAKQYFLLDIEWECLKKLRTIYALKGFPNETQSLTFEAEKVRADVIFIDQIKSYWEVMQAKIKFYIGIQPAWAAEAHAAEKFSIQSNHPLAILYAFRFRNIRLLHTQSDYEDLKENTENWQLHLLEYPYLNTPNRQLELFKVQIRTHRYAGEFVQALQKIKKAIKLTEYRAFNKFEIQELYFDTLLKIDEPKNGYKQAGLILSEVIQTPQFEWLDKWDKATWRLREAYLYLILSERDPKLIKKFTPNFHEKEPISQLPCDTITKDKTGYNLIRIWLKVLLLRRSRAYTDFTAEANNLRNYYQRHFQELHDERTKQFVYQLVKISQHHFDSNYVGETNFDFPSPHFNPVEIGRYEQIKELIS